MGSCELAEKILSFSAFDAEFGGRTMWTWTKRKGLSLSSFFKKYLI